MGIDTTRTLIPKFDRTGTPPEHRYDLAAEVLYQDHPDVGRREVIFHVERPSETDPTTFLIGATRFADGRCLVWGEFESGDRCWLRDDDEVARAFIAQNEDLFRMPAPPRSIDPTDVPVSER